MKSKKFKPNYRRDFASKQRVQGGSKRTLIIAISIAVAVLIIAAIIVAVVFVNKNQQNQGATDVDWNNVQTGVDSAPSAPDKDTLVNIQVAHLPNRTSYYCGDAFEPDGLSVYGLTKADKFVKLDLLECQITGFDSSVPNAKQTITVMYKDFTDTFDVIIKEAPKPVTNMVVSVVVETLPKTVYGLNDFLDTTGGVLLCAYSDGTTKQVDLKPENVSGFKYAKKAGVGEYDLTVKYTEDNVTVETTYKITITE